MSDVLITQKMAATMLTATYVIEHNQWHGSYLTPAIREPPMTDEYISKHGPGTLLDIR